MLLWLTATSGGQAQDFNYTNTNGTITITGYTGPGGYVTIPATINGFPVNCIGPSAFAFNNNLTGVTIPESITSIGYEAFYQCSGLTNIDIGSGVTNIGANAFGFCFNLMGVTIPNSVTSIEGFAFQLCSSLTNVTLGSGVTTIGYGAFNACRLTDIMIPNSVTSIGDYAFQSCTNLTSLHFEGNAPSIVEIAAGINVFLGDNATSITCRELQDGVQLLLVFRQQCGHCPIRLS